MNPATVLTRGDAGTAPVRPCELTDLGASLQDVMLSIRVSAESHTPEVLAQFEQLWRDRLGRIGDVLAEPERGESR